jgi:predicted RND superfamily exporter protein
MCEREYVFLSKVCPECRKIKNFMNCYSRERVLQIIENVLSRTEDKQNNKIKEEIKEEIEKKQYNLRNSKVEKK